MDLFRPAEESTLQAIHIASGVGADPEAIEALREALRTEMPCSMKPNKARRDARVEADQARQATERSEAQQRSSGESQTPKVQAALRVATMRHYTREAYNAKENAEQATQSAEDALAAASVAVDHLMIVYDAYDIEWNAYDAIQRAGEDIKVASMMPPDALQASQGQLSWTALRQPYLMAMPTKPSGGPSMRHVRDGRLTPEFLNRLQPARSSYATHTPAPHKTRSTQTRRVMASCCRDGDGRPFCTQLWRGQQPTTKGTSDVR